MPQAGRVAFIPTFYYPAIRYTEDAYSFYLYPLASRAECSKRALMSSGRDPAACHSIPFGYHIFEHAVAVGEGCKPLIDEPLDVLAFSQFRVRRGMVNVIGSKDFVGYICVPRD